MISLRLAQNRQHVRRGRRTTVFALAELEADQSTRVLDEGRNVALAIDCSGSMYGKKMSDAKRAAEEVARGLGPQDTVSIVSFAGDVDVKVRAAGASDPRVRRAIRALEPGGGTAMHGGMAAGFELLRKAGGGLGRLALFSDGEPNTGPCRGRDFEALAAGVRAAGMTVDVFGIGSDYNGPLLMRIAEAGGGKWQHVQDSDELTRMVSTRMEDMRNTVIAAPQLVVTLMPGAELVTMASTKPVLREIGPDARATSGNATSVPLADLVQDEAQAVAMRIAVPPGDGGTEPLLTVSVVDGGSEVASQTGTITYTDDAGLCNAETDPSPRVILSSSEATVLLRRGLEGDGEATRTANTILEGLSDPETTRLMDADAAATVLNARAVAGSVGGRMSEADRKRVLHDTTVIGARPGAAPSAAACPSCGRALRPAARFCGGCGKDISGRGGA